MTQYLRGRWYSLKNIVRPYSRDKNGGPGVSLVTILPFLNNIFQDFADKNGTYNEDKMKYDD